MSILLPVSSVTAVQVTEVVTETDKLVKEFVYGMAITVIFFNNPGAYEFNFCSIMILIDHSSQRC